MHFAILLSDFHIYGNEIQICTCLLNRKKTQKHTIHVKFCQDDALVSFLCVRLTQRTNNKLKLLIYVIVLIDIHALLFI